MLLINAYLLLYIARVGWTHPWFHREHHSNALFDQNVLARIWRTAQTGPPVLNDEEGWPQYTQGAFNNAPPSDSEPGTYVNTAASGWTAGFFPDMLWQSYRRRKSLLPETASFLDEPDLRAWLEMANAWTEPLITNVNLTDTHDIGFLAKPFESALHIADQRQWLPILATMSENLASRFIPAPGVIRSWDTNNASANAFGSHADSVLVIIDNMMNLALLAHSSFEYTKNATLLDLAVSHANRTRDHHVRADGSTFHVCDYSADTGVLYLCRTAQGLADWSTWARGQAWAIYGFAQMYSFTGDRSYLDTSVRCADWFIDHLPEDVLPFWDFDAPYLPDVTPRDSSAAGIAASGMLLLQDQLRHHERGRSRSWKYGYAAMRLLNAACELALAGEISFAELEDGDAPLGAVTNISTPADTKVSRGFESILMHGTANNNPNAGEGTSYDTGLVYGDFYLLEAGNRLLGMSPD